jgi:hypothetical protein
MSNGCSCFDETLSRIDTLLAINLGSELCALLQQYWGFYLVSDAQSCGLVPRLGLY